MNLKKGSRGPAVTSLIRQLRKLGFTLPVGDLFTAEVKKSVEAFQSSNVDASGLPLTVDGEVGANTAWALNAALKKLTPQTAQFGLPPLPPGGTPAGRAALQVALAELAAGRGEFGSDNNGPDIRKYLSNVVTPPANWCAGFVSWCFRQALSRDPVFGYLVGAQAIHKRMHTLGNTYPASMTNLPQPGDIIVWRRVDPANPAGTAWMGHVGMVHSFSGGILWTVEGNRGPFPAKVGSFRYGWSQLVVSASNDNFKGLFGLSRHP